MITEAQRQTRRAYLGSSDLPAILGYDPWKNVADIFYEKTGALEGDVSTDAAKIGSHLEGAILSMFEEETGFKVERNIWLERSDAGFPACANLDGAIRDGGMSVRIKAEHLNQAEPRHLAIAAIVEAKSTSRQDEWDERSGDIPLRVLIQTHWQMWVSEAPRGYSPVLFPDFGRFKFKNFPIERHEELIAELIHKAARFRNDHILRDIPPHAVMPAMETLKRLRREPQSVIQLDGEALAAWRLMEQAKQSRKECDEIIETYYKQILLMLGTAEAGELPTGEMLTYLEQNSQRTCDWTLLEARLKEVGHFQIFTETVKQGRHRVLRLKKAKGK